MDHDEYAPEDLLGPLSEVERVHAPRRLFSCGDVGLLRGSGRVAVIGSRDATPDGVRRAKKLSFLLVQRRITIVSGLAEGIDTAAHTAAIEAGGRTIAVIGTPLDRSYPSSNAALQAKIMREHLVLSQFPVGVPVQRDNFPSRNRTMALVSDATVIIEAGETSGTLHQAREALRLDGPLFLTRSLVDNRSLTWPSNMLALGAHVLSDSTLEVLFSLVPNRRRGPTASE